MTIRHYYDKAVPNAVYLYDFGGAHGRQVYSKVEDLINDITKILKNLKLLDHKGGYFLYGITNGNQTAQRKMLDSMGFKSTYIGNLVQHSITHVEFSTAAALAIEAAMKEEARLEAEKKKAEEERIARDIKEGRKPGELRVGDVLYCRQHISDQNTNNRYVCVSIGKTTLQYASTANLSYYTIESLARTSASMPISEWVRVPSEVEAQVLKQYPTLVEFRSRGEKVATKAS